MTDYGNNWQDSFHTNPENPLVGLPKNKPVELTESQVATLVRMFPSWIPVRNPDGKVSVYNYDPTPDVLPTPSAEENHQCAAVPIPAPQPPDTVQIGDFSPVKMNTDQIDVARYLEIRYRSLAREIIDLLPPAAHRDQALRELLISKMMLVHAISRTPEVKL